MIAAIALSAASASALTPEAETMLASLRRRVAAGEIGEAAYDRFLENLEENSGCDAWSPDDDEDWAESLREACPEGDDGRTPGRARFAVAQAVYPRAEKTPPPSLSASASAPWGAAEASTREGRPYRRLLRAETQRFTLAFGHVLPEVDAARLDFVAGRKMYAGWSGRSGPEDGPWAADYSALDGAGAAWRADGFSAAAFATWNRLVASSGNSPLRRDASTFALGLSGKARRLRWRFAAAREAFESGEAAPEAVTVAGAEIAVPGRARLGLAVSDLQSRRVDQEPGVSTLNKERPGSGFSPGAFLLAGLESREGERAGYSLEIRQADAGWANPLSAAEARARDTEGVTLRLPGRGEGGFSLRSHFGLWEKGGLRCALGAGGGAAWRIDERAFLGAEGRLSVTTRLGDWTHEAGMGLSENPPGTLYRRAQAWGQWLEWNPGAFRTRASLWRSAAAENPEASLTLAGRTQACEWLVEGIIEDVEGGSRFRFAFRQAWRLGKGASVTQMLRMPWTEEGMRSDVNYRLGLEWTGF